jgi:hypothetical protein
MPRIPYATTAALLVAATMHVTAQQPGGGSLPVPRATVERAKPMRLQVPKILPGTRPDVFGAIQGNALTVTDEALTSATVRLRDARAGQIIGSQTTDGAGLFAFPTVDPGSYVVELLGVDQTSVLAASQILFVGPGEAISAVVKVPFTVSPFAGILGRSTPSADAVTTHAASSGVLAAQIAGAPTCLTPAN